MAKGNNLSAMVHRVTQGVSSIYVAVGAFFVMSLALTVGVVFGFPQWWQTILYSANALVASLMLFVIQHTSHQQTGAILLKLDELIHTSADARNEVIDAEHQDVPTQKQLHDRLHH
jgi:low affinity Fe/Cu permease